MKHTLTAVLVMTALGATAANAQTVESLTHTVGMTAIVPPVCSFTSPPMQDDGRLSGVSAANSTFTLPIDPVAASVSAEATDALTFTQAFCNTDSTISLSRNGFKHEDFDTLPPLPSQMLKQIHYSAKVTWGSTATLVALPASGTNSATAPVGPKIGDLRLEISVPVDPAPLVAGDYTDTLTFSVVPNV
jgi:hypothetical protein